ncbi:hypothetical protein F2Q69_00036304 [Brassica cretica]|uniref:Methyltransferase domain-containing protein n=1 Tax=Brassica cretica TaxID=69181 RepID=A0A8S9SUT7_BRACR|nr:hypothetical protein F2Q69_00036304 [Brassica cretica]
MKMKTGEPGHMFRKAELSSPANGELRCPWKALNQFPLAATWSCIVRWITGGQFTFIVSLPTKLNFRRERAKRCSRMEKGGEAGEYHSKDFEWEFVKNLVENDPSLSHHLQEQHLVDYSSFSSSDSKPWQDFHSRHSSGKFFKMKTGEPGHMFRKAELSSPANGELRCPWKALNQFPLAATWSCIVRWITGGQFTFIVSLPTKLNFRRERAKRCSRMEKGGEAGEYHSKDFEWEFVKNLVENDPSLSHHLQEQHLVDYSSFSSSDSKPWQDFHSRHSSGKFFKERRYLLKEFPELVLCGENTKLLEVGCGNGSTVLPLLRGSKNITVYACDCSSEALVRTKENINRAIATVDNFHSFTCDFSTSAFPNWLACHHCRHNKHCHHSGKSDDTSLNEHCIGGVDFVTLVC